MLTFLGGQWRLRRGMCRAEVHRIILQILVGCLVITGMLGIVSGADLTYDEPVGGLDVTSVPPGASVYVDGTYMAKTPIDDLTIAAGQHTLRVSLAGYNDEVRTIIITAGWGTDVHVDLTPTTGSLTLNTIPSGATLVFDGVNRGTTPVTLTGLTAGSHTARFSLAGYQEDTETLTVVAGGTGGYTFTLSPAGQAPTTGGLALNTIPSGATVVLDGVVKGTTPITLTGLSAGAHTIRVSLSGYEEQSQTVNVIGGQTSPYNVPLTAIKGGTPEEFIPELQTPPPSSGSFIDIIFNFFAGIFGLKK